MLKTCMPLHERDIYYFIDVTLAHLNKITGNEVVLRDPTIEFQSLVFSAYTGLLHLKGGVEGFVYLTASQQFLQMIYNSRPNRGKPTDESCRDVITDIINTVANNVHKRFGPALHVSEPRIFSTVPDDPIEMPPAVFVQPFVWRGEHAYYVLGLTSAEIS
jgi:CheY-specific phosphatase CheX